VCLIHSTKKANIPPGGRGRSPGTYVYTAKVIRNSASRAALEIKKAATHPAAFSISFIFYLLAFCRRYNLNIVHSGNIATGPPIRRFSRQISRCWPGRRIIRTIIDTADTSEYIYQLGHITTDYITIPVCIRRTPEIFQQTRMVCRRASEIIYQVGNVRAGSGRWLGPCIHVNIAGEIFNSIRARRTSISRRKTHHAEQYYSHDPFHKSSLNFKNAFKSIIFDFFTCPVAVNYATSYPRFILKLLLNNPVNWIFVAIG